MQLALSPDARVLVRRPRRMVFASVTCVPVLLGVVSSWTFGHMSLAKHIYGRT